MQTVQAQILVNAAGPWVGDVLAATMAKTSRRASGWSKARTSWCRSCTPRPLLYFSKSRQAHHIRDPLRRRLHTDRDDGKRLRRRPRQGQATAEEIDYLCQAANRYFRLQSARRRWSGRILACGRYMMTAQGGSSGYERLCAGTGRGRRADAFRYWAVRSQRIGVSRNTHSISSNGICPQSTPRDAPGPRIGRCRAVIFPSKASMP